MAERESSHRIILIMSVCVCESLSRVRLFATAWTVAHQAPLSTGSSRQEHWSGLSFPSPGDTNNSGVSILSVLLPATSILQRIFDVRALPPGGTLWGTVLSFLINEEIGLEISLPRSLLRIIHAHVKSKKSVLGICIHKISTSCSAG